MESGADYREFVLWSYSSESVKIKVTDSLGYSDSLNIPPLIGCWWGRGCYDGLNFETTTECIESEQVIVYTNIRPKYKDIVIQSFWLDKNGKQHPLQIPIDTIPNHSYYYVELATLGHWDGYTQCLTTDIETASSAFASSFLRIFPNPNRGTFNYLISTENKTKLSLQLKVYNTFGQLIWEGRGTANEEETIDIQNMASGLYFMEARSAEERWVEKFWVE